MKINFTSKFWKRLVLFVILIPILVFTLLISVVYFKQDAIVKHIVELLNEDFEGELVIDGSHISPFENFPYISIDLENVRVYPDKITKEHAIVHVKDLYVGFDIPKLLGGAIEIKSIKLNEGDINIIQDINGELNIVKAFQTTKEIEDPSEEFHLDLKKIQLTNVDISKLNEENGLLVDSYVSDGTIRFKSSPDTLLITLDTRFILNVLDNNDTTYIKRKHFELNTSLSYISKEDLISISPSELKMEKASFSFNGTMDLDNDLELDLTFSGKKPNFDLFIAFAPEELIPTLERYENEGNVYFDAHLKGKAINGHFPKLEANFGCGEAYFTNTFNHKKMDDLQFKGHFLAESIDDLSSMEFSISDFSARPEAGTFKGNITVKNFETPDINMQINSDFDLEFLSKFFELNDLKNLKGKIELSMNFHDIIDLEHPERSIEKMNQAYFTELKVTDLSFLSPDFHLPVKDIDIHISVKGIEAEIHYINALIGSSDIKLKGKTSNFPAIIHHTDEQITTSLSVASKWLDLEELTKSNRNPTEFIDEQIENFSVDFAFKSSARALTESKSLPIGEFFINNLYAKFKHYPHVLHDFNADVFIDEHDFRVIDFSGEIDKSDFHFTGKLANYDLWFDENPNGDTQIDFKIVSNQLLLDDILSYKGVNYVPEEYQHEELKQLNIDGHADLHFKKELYSADIYLKNLTAKLKIHPLKLEHFKGRFHIEDEHLIVEQFSGKLGHSSFTTNMNYYYGSDNSIRKRDNYFSFSAPRLDVDELTNYTSPAPTDTIDHDAIFNIYDLPFTDMKFDVTIGLLNYHKYKVSNIKSTLRTKENHYIYIDKLDMDIADGHVFMKGYINGSNSKALYISPDITFKQLDLDKLMLKFDNFGQDEFVAGNIHGKISGRLTGKIHVHTDMTPMMDDSEIHLDLEINKGRLDNYGPMHSLSDYFKDKNLDRIIFDTLRNHIDMTNGTLTIPAMTINTSLGFLEISGKQDKDYNMEYFIRVPVSMITSIAASKLFGKTKAELDATKDDEIIRRDPNKNTRFVTIKIEGNTEDYTVSLSKK
jgi:hypothetical protein